MNLMINILAFLFSFIAMEFVAWFMHKYVMHGFLWELHRDHHQGAKGKLHKNDWFILIFALPSMAGIFFGLYLELSVLIWIGVGIALYGLIYFLIHESFIHQRFKIFPKHTDNYYFKGIKKAHRMHHSHTTKEDGESFGLLVVSKKYFE